MPFSHMLHSLDFSAVSSATYDNDLLIEGFFYFLTSFFFYSVGI